MAPLALVVAKTSNGGIGFQGNLPWHPKSLSADMNWFKKLTTHGFTVDSNGVFHANSSATDQQNTVIMGRKNVGFDTREIQTASKAYQSYTYSASKKPKIRPSKM